MDSLTYRILQPKIIIGFEQFSFIDSENCILNTEDGFSWINPVKTPTTASNFKVFISNIIVTNDNTTSSEARHFFANPSETNSFSNKHNSLRFEFNAPEYRNDGLVEYSYMLEGYDKSWSDFSPENTKEYNQLPRGNYIFKIRARCLLETEMAVCSYEFVIEPAWYETNFAYGVYILLFFMLVLGIVFLISHKSKKGALEMERIKEMEIQAQKKVFEEENQAKKREIKELKNQQLQYELRHKSQELANSTMNLIRKNEMLLDIVESITKTSDDIRKNSDQNVIISRLTRMERSIRQNIENDNNWKKFEANFDLVYENYLKRLGENYPDLNVSDKKICAYIKMDLSSKDMAPLLNMSVRSIETNRYRIRQKLSLERDVNLADFLQKF
jgi:DNA-binding CsgD family transcriptional regulator